MPALRTWDRSIMLFDIICTDDCGWGTTANTIEDATWLRNQHHSPNHRTIVYDSEQNLQVKLI